MASPFVDLYLDYDAWFERFPLVYEAELRAVRSLLPVVGRGLEVGVGSGRFAGPLTVGIGLDPSPGMLALARERGVRVMAGRAEALPVRSGSLDTLLMVTVLCFIKEPLRALQEARRVVKEGGRAVIAFIDRQSPLGQSYEANRQTSAFYGGARFYAVDEALALLRQTGFTEFSICQTIASPLNEIGPNEPVRAGWGQGAFVVVAAS